MRILPSADVSHCVAGGWIPGNKIDGIPSRVVRTHVADTSLNPIPKGADEQALVLLSDILPTGVECGVLKGRVQPGSTVAIVGAGLIGLAALLTAQFYAPGAIVMIDLDDNRLEGQTLLARPPRSTASTATRSRR